MALITVTSNRYITIYGENMSDSQRFAPKNSPEIAKIIAIQQNFRQYRRKAILYPIYYNDVQIFVILSSFLVEGGDNWAEII